jgi:hypothetical protein
VDRLGPKFNYPRNFNVDTPSLNTILNRNSSSFGTVTYGRDRPPQYVFIPYTSYRFLHRSHIDILSRFLIVLTGREKETATNSALHAVEHTSRNSRSYRRGSQKSCLRNLYLSRLRLFLIFLKILLICTINI